MCGSYADYQVGSTVGTTLSWDYSSSSGTVKDQSSSAYFDDFSAALKAFSLIAGPNSAAMSTASEVLGAVKSIYNTDKITTQESGSGHTESKGWAITLKEEFKTNQCQKEDLFIYLQNVLFVYLVLPKDPVSGNITPYGVPTVVLTAVHYDEPLVPLSASQLQAQLPPAVAQQLIALDLQMNPSLLALAVRTSQPQAPSGANKNSASSQPHAGRPPDVRGPMSGRLSYVEPFPCPTTYSASLEEDSTLFRQSGTYQTKTTVTTTNVTGFLASVLGRAGETIQSATYSSNVSNWQNVVTGSEIVLQCPEYAPVDAWTMQIYLDTMLGSLLAVPSGPYQPSSAQSSPQGIQGTVYDTQGRPASNQPVRLKIAGRKYGTVTDRNGSFAFRSWQR